MDDRVFRANHERVLQTFSRPEFLNHWNAFSVYCMELTAAFIHYYELDNGGMLPPGLQPDELEKKNIEVNETMTRRDVEMIRDGHILNLDFQAFYNSMQVDVHRTVVTKKREVESATAKTKEASTEIERLRAELIKCKEASTRDLQAQKDASSKEMQRDKDSLREARETYAKGTDALKAEISALRDQQANLERLITGEARKTDNILANFQEDTKKSDAVRDRLMQEIDRLQTMDLNSVPELNQQITRLHDMLTGKKEFQSEVEGIQRDLASARQLLGAAQRENDDLKTDNARLKNELDTAKADLDRLRSDAALPRASALNSALLSTLQLYSTHCNEFDQGKDETLQFAMAKIRSEDFGDLDTATKAIFKPILEYVKGSLLTMHLIQKCIAGCDNGNGVYGEYANQVAWLLQNHPLPSHFSRKKWPQILHCVNGLGNFIKQKEFMATIKLKLAITDPPLNPKILFTQTPANGHYNLQFTGNVNETEAPNSAGLPDKVMLAYETKLIMVRQQSLNLLGTVHALNQFLLPLVPETAQNVAVFAAAARQILATTFQWRAEDMEKALRSVADTITQALTTAGLLAKPTFPMQLFVSGFMIDSPVDVAKCITTRHNNRADSFTNRDYTVFSKEIRDWFMSKYLQDPDSNPAIETVLPIS